MSVGLLSLLEHIGALMRMTATTTPGVAAQAVTASAKAVGTVIDDAAVIPSYVGGLSADRELPIVAKMAMGSVRNKVVFILPIVMLLSIFLPGLITPLLMLGGSYLCYEGAEKIVSDLMPGLKFEHQAETPGAQPLDAADLERIKVEAAIKTDFVLSAEIMVIALSTLPKEAYLTQALVLAVVGLSITALVYGGVALIVKLDDVGVYVSGNGRTATGRRVGSWLVGAMPGLMDVIGVIGTAAMIWVGGGFVAEGLAWFGLTWFADAIEAFSEAALEKAPFAASFASWLVDAVLSALVGLVAGLLLLPVVRKVILPAWQAIRRLVPKFH